MSINRRNFINDRDFMAETLASAGIEGFDVPVRARARIKPEQVKEDLPRIIEIGKVKNLYVPLGEGIVNFDLYFKTLRDLNIKAPITLHTEYRLLTNEEEQLPLLRKQKILVTRIKKDVDFIRGYLSKYQLN